MLKNILPFVHESLKEIIQTGDIVIDATAGNGHDTVFLAEKVGSNGQVWAFDIQQSALMTTRQRLEKRQLQQQVRLIHDSHEYMNQYVNTGVRAIMFNLGYLPGGDKVLTTNVASSLQAIKIGLSSLMQGGLISIVLYPGHEAGQKETEAILSWAKQLSQQQVAVLQYGFINRIHNAPFALLLQKLLS